MEIDSIMSQYTYWKEVTKIMKAKEANISKTLNGKQQQLQQAAANFQQNVQANKYTQAQAQQIQGDHGILLVLVELSEVVVDAVGEGLVILGHLARWSRA